jgi:hypothetical protein
MKTTLALLFCALAASVVHAQPPSIPPSIVTRYTGHGVPSGVPNSITGDNYIDLDTGNVYFCISLFGCSTNAVNLWLQSGTSADAVTMASPGTSGHVITSAGGRAAQDSGVAVSALAPLDSPTFTGSFVASGAIHTSPLQVGTSLPGTCTTGELYYKSNVTSGQNLYGCTATNTWTLEGGPGYTSLTQDGTTAQLVASRSFAGAAASAGGPSGGITIDLATCNRCEVGVLSGNITGVTFTHPKAGLKFSTVYTQAHSSAFTLAYGGSAANTCPLLPDADNILTQQFEVAADGSTIKGTDCVIEGVSNLAAYGSTSSSPSITPGSGKLDCRYTDAAGLDCLTSDGNHHQLIVGLNNPSDSMVVNYIDKSGVQHRVAQSGGGYDPTDVTVLDYFFYIPGLGGSNGPLPWGFAGNCFAVGVPGTPADGGQFSTYMQEANSSGTCLFYTPFPNGFPFTDFMSGGSPKSYIFSAVYQRNTSDGDGTHYVGVSKSRSTLDDFVGVRLNPGTSKYECVIRSGGVDVNETDIAALDTAVHWITVTNSGVANSVTCTVGNNAPVTTTGTIPSGTWLFAMGATQTSGTSARFLLSEARVHISGRVRF